MKGYKDPVILRAAYETHKTMERVAEHFGVSKKLVLVHMKRFGISRTPKKYRIDVAHVAARLDSGEPLIKIAKEMGIYYGTLREHLTEHGIKSDRRPSTGRRLNENGYILVRMPGHHRASNGYVREHILVMEAKLGRPVLKGEHVHHLNGNKQDNRPENLTVMTPVEHKRLHTKSWRMNARYSPTYSDGKAVEAGNKESLR